MEELFIMSTAQAEAQPKAPPPFFIKSRAERVSQKYIKMLVYADFGVGKTYLAGTAAEVESMGDVLMLNAESGELTLDTTDEHNFEAIDMVSIVNFRQAANVYDFLRVHCKLRDAGDIEGMKKHQARLTGQEVEDIADGDVRRYRTVIIDSLTELQVYCMNQLLGIDGQTGLAEETQSPEWAEYKKQFHMLQRLMRAFRDLPIHVIITCARTYEQDDQKRMMFNPKLTGQLSLAVQGFVDIVGYLVLGSPNDKGEIPRRMFVQPIGRYAAKNRFSCCKASHFDNPTMKSILTGVGLLKSTEATQKGK